MAIWDDVVPVDERYLFVEKGWQSGELPHGTRPAVLVVDMTNAFVTDDYPTGWAATGMPAAAAIKDLLGVVRSKSVPVIYTAGRLGSSVQGGSLNHGSRHSCQGAAAVSVIVIGSAGQLKDPKSWLAWAVIVYVSATEKSNVAVQGRA